MKIRSDSWIIAVSCLIAGLLLWRGATEFAQLFAEFERPLPPLSKAVFSVHPLMWLVLFALLAVAVIVRDSARQSSRPLPNWPFLLTLGVICLFVVVGLFQPLITYIPFSGNDYDEERMTEPGTGANGETP